MEHARWILPPDHFKIALLNATTNMTWQIPTAWPELQQDAVHVWTAEFDPWRTEVADALTVLSSDERQRAGSFRHQDRRECSILTRGILRHLLARYCGMEARAIEFCYGPHGKPLLGNTSAQLHFNTSHSNSVVAFAFTRAGEVGVDVELVRSAIPLQIEIAQRHFSPGELNQLLALPDAERAEGFFRCWTRKEAFLKARGDGVFGGLNTFEVSLAKDDARLLSVGGDRKLNSWWMAALPEIKQHVGAVVVQSPECRIECWRVTPEFLAQNKL